MKPVELIERALVNSSRKKGLVVDLFGGSGSTLIASEKLSRRARLMEIDPRYADVTIRRFMEYSGKTAVLEGTVKSFDEVSKDRRQSTA